jgi:hypothetical protein
VRHPAADQQDVGLGDAAPRRPRHGRLADGVRGAASCGCRRRTRRAS